jgi:hypothetical protein
LIKNEDETLCWSLGEHFVSLDFHSAFRLKLKAKKIRTIGATGSSSGAVLLYGPGTCPTGHAIGIIWDDLG